MTSDSTELHINLPKLAWPYFWNLLIKNHSMDLEIQQRNSFGLWLRGWEPKLVNYENIKIPEEMEETGVLTQEFFDKISEAGTRMAAENRADRRSWRKQVRKVKVNTRIRIVIR